VHYEQTVSGRQPRLLLDSSIHSYISPTYPPHTPRIPPTYPPHTPHISPTYPPHTPHVPPTYPPRTPHVPSTYPPNTPHIPPPACCSYSFLRLRHCTPYIPIFPRGPHIPPIYPSYTPHIPLKYPQGADPCLLLIQLLALEALVHGGYTMSKQSAAGAPCLLFVQLLALEALGTLGVHRGYTGGTQGVHYEQTVSATRPLPAARTASCA